MSRILLSLSAAGTQIDFFKLFEHNQLDCTPIHLAHISEPVFHWGGGFELLVFFDRCESSYFCNGFGAQADLQAKRASKKEIRPFVYCVKSITLSFADSLSLPVGKLCIAITETASNTKVCIFALPYRILSNGSRYPPLTQGLVGIADHSSVGQECQHIQARHELQRPDQSKLNRKLSHTYP